MCRIVLVIWLLVGVNLVRAQSVITADNIEQLRSVQHIDFDTLPVIAGEILNGQFFVNDNGSLLAIVNTQGQLVIMNDEGQLQEITDIILTDNDFPATFIDGAFGDERFVAVHTIGNGYVVTIVDQAGVQDNLTFMTPDKPVAIWSAPDAVWLEVISNEPNMPPYLVRLIDGEATIEPFAPAQVENVVVRIGRLALPQAVIVTDNNEVQHWNLETGALIGQVRTAETPLYGHMLPGSDHMVWRDPASTTLHMLNFATGEDLIVTQLDGSYIPFLFMNASADAVLGVNVDDEPVVVAWIVEQGDRLPLGLYRQCNRPPDKVILSADSTTLIIGCDTGLDIWRNQG